MTKQDYNNFCIIQKAVITQDTDGSEIKTWEDLHFTFCSIRKLSCNEKIANAQTFVDAKYMLEMWYIEGITEEMQIVVNGQVFNINAVDNVNFNNETLRITCS